MAVNYNFRIMHQVWDVFKLHSTVSDKVCNDVKPVSSAQKCRQAHCTTLKIPKNETMNKENDHDSLNHDHEELH